MKLEKNSQGIYSVRLDNGRLLMDEDLMLLIPGSHRSSPQLFSCENSAMEGYYKYKAIHTSAHIFTISPVIKQDFEEVK